jgi:DNA-binding transcriptional ArsR family regulator
MNIILLNNNKLILNLSDIKIANSTLKLVSNPISVKIIKLLEEYKLLSITEIFKKINLNNEQITLVLNKLIDNNLVNIVKGNGINYYKLDTINFKHLSKIVFNLTIV